MLFSWTPERASGEPLYKQLAGHIAEMIGTGYFANGDKLPSQRVMAGRFGLGRNTVIRALEELAKTGIISASPKSGVYIISRSAETAPDWDAYFRRANYHPGVDDYRMWRDKGDLRDLRLSREFDMLAYFKDAIAAAAVRTDAMTVLDAHGLPPLREAIVRHMKISCALDTAVDNVIICPSLDQSIYTLCAALMTGGGSLVHERATLINIVSNIHSLGLNMLPVGQDRFGILPEDLDKTLSGRSHAVMFTDPIAHSPTGITTTKRRQRDLMKIINKYRIPVIENGHKRDLWCGKPFPPPMKSLPGSENIIYLGSLLKASMRLGVSWVVADRPFVEQLSNVLVQFSTIPSGLAQVVMDEMFRSGRYYEMMGDAWEFVHRRRVLALQLCERYLKDLAQWDEKRCGFHFWIELNARINKDKIYDAPNFFPGYFFDKSDSTHVLLTPPSLPEAELEETVKSIARLAR
jgi:GntR family transcriptional regulator of abcA and norABC